MTSATDTTYDFDENVDLTNWSDKSSDFVLELKHDVVELISEPQRLLDSGELYSDPLDVFDDIDFTWVRAKPCIQFLLFSITSSFSFLPNSILAARAISRLFKASPSSCSDF